MLTFPSVLLFVNIPGTPATVTQLAKDVCTFLKWAAGKRSFLFSLQGSKGLLPFTKKLRKLRWKVPSGEERVQFYIRFSLSLFKIQDGRTDIALNCLDLANPSEKLKVELVFPLEKFPTGELDKEPDKERENRTKNRHEIGQK